MKFKIAFWAVIVLTFVMGIPVFLNVVLAPSGNYREPTSQEQALIDQAGVKNNVTIVEDLNLWGTSIAGYVNMFEFDDTVYMRPFGDVITSENVWMSKLVHETAHDYQRTAVVNENGNGWGYIAGLLTLNSVSEHFYVGEDYEFGLVSFSGLERNADCMTMVLAAGNLNSITLTYTGEYEDCDANNVTLAQSVIAGESLINEEVIVASSENKGFSNPSRTVGSFQK